MWKIKKIIIILTGNCIINMHAQDLPPKPTVSIKCGEKSAQANTYIANVQYLQVLSAFVAELQKIVQRYQNSVERYRIQMSENQKNIEALKNQATQKRRSISILQKEILDLLSNEQLQFKYLNNAMCRHEGAKTVLMASRILDLNPDKYFAKAASLMKSAITVMESCGNLTGNPIPKGNVNDNVALLEKLQNAYQLKDTTKIRQEEYSKRAAKIFADIQLRILNEYILLTQKERPYLTQAMVNKKQPDPFPIIDSTPPPDRKVIDNLIERALFSARPEIFEKTLRGFTNRIDTFIKQQEKDWLRDITLYKFGYKACDCENICKNSAEKDRSACLQRCTEKTREQLGWQKRNCDEACKTTLESCQKFCASGDCSTACMEAKTKCLANCTQDNEQKNTNWEYCVSCNKESEKCAQYQPLGLVDIQGQINALIEQIAKPEAGKPIPTTNIPAKIDHIMGKINVVKGVITTSQTAIQKTQEAIKATTITTLLPNETQAKQACATDLQSMLAATVSTDAATTAAQQLEEKLKKTYGDD